LWHDKRAQFLAIWSIGAIVLFSIISGKQVHYLLPVLPAFAIALAAGPLPGIGFGAALSGLVVIVPVLIWTVLLAVGRAGIDGTPVTTLGTFEVTVSIALSIAGLAMLMLAGLRDTMLGWALVTPVTLTVAHVALHAPLMEHFDTARFADELSRAPKAGVAVYGLRYQGEFGFTARLSGAVEIVEDGSIDAWAEAHPGGLIVSGQDFDGGFAKVAEGWLAGKIVRLYRVR
jgi:4-amino-4-deoxy-L-arabinose transferase-like glycosyltransferase